MDIEKMLRQKTTWACLLVMLNAPLLAFGVPPKIVGGIVIFVGGLAGIFARQGIQKAQDK
jgi:hypothetical protein